MLQKKENQLFPTIPDLVAGPLGIIEDVLQMDHFSSVLSSVSTTIKDTMEYIDSLGGNNLLNQWPNQKVRDRQG